MCSNRKMDNIIRPKGSLNWCNTLWCWW